MGLYGSLLNSCIPELKVFQIQNLLCINLDFELLLEEFRDKGICRNMSLVQTLKCSFSIMGPHIF